VFEFIVLWLSFLLKFPTIEYVVSNVSPDIVKLPLLAFPVQTWTQLPLFILYLIKSQFSEVDQFIVTEFGLTVPWVILGVDEKSLGIVGNVKVPLKSAYPKVHGVPNTV